MAEEKRGKSKYAIKLAIRKRLSGSRGVDNFKGKKLPVPLPLFEDADYFSTT